MTSNDPIYIHRPAGPIKSVDRWTLQEILTEALRTGNLSPHHLEAIKTITDLLTQ